jgi:hypothetical protein
MFTLMSKTTNHKIADITAATIMSTHTKTRRDTPIKVDVPLATPVA